MKQCVSATLLIQLLLHNTTANSIVSEGRIMRCSFVVSLEPYRANFGIECGNGTCLPLSKYRDCVTDCDDGIDEACYPGLIKCGCDCVRYDQVKDLCTEPPQAHIYQLSISSTSTTTHTPTTMSDGNNCILLIGGYIAGGTFETAVEYYHPDQGVECNLHGIRMSTARILRETAWTSGCYLADGHQVLIRESRIVGSPSKPPMIYWLHNGSANALPLPYHSFASYSTSATVNASRCISCGGRDGNRELDECYEYDTGWMTQRWWLIASLPHAQVRLAASTALAGSDYFFIGGLDQRGSQLNEVYRYNLLNRSWSQEEAMIGGGRLKHAAAALSPTELIVCGGHTTRADCEVYDTVRQRWRQISSMTVGREEFAMVTFDGVVYAMGGGGLGRQTAEKYDTTADKWIQVKPLPRARMAHIAVVV